MASNEENPLMPLTSVQLTDDEKDLMWKNIVRMANKTPLKAPKTNQGFRTRWLATAPLAVLGVALLVGYTDPQFLNIGKSFNLLRLKMFSPPQVSKGVSLGYGEKVNQGVTNQGITLTIGNVYADPTKLEFDMVESFARERITHPVIQDSDVTLNVNGTRKLTGFSGGEFQEVSGGKYAGVVYFPVMNDEPYAPLPTTFTLNIHVHEIGRVKGNWSFSIPVSQKKLHDHTRDIHPDVTVSSKGYTMKITNVEISPVQTVIQSTITIPANGTMPNQMVIIDNEGQIIGGGIANQKVVRETPSGRVIQMTIIGNAPSKGAARFSITPIRDFSSPIAPIQGPYPKTVTVQPGLQAKITGIDFNANDTVVRLSMDQATYKRLTTYKGHSIDAQFFLVAVLGPKSSESVGSMSVKFDSPTSNTIQIIFGKVDPNKKWGLERSYSLPQPGLDTEVPLK